MLRRSPNVWGLTYFALALPLVACGRRSTLAKRWHVAGAWQVVGYEVVQHAGALKAGQTVSRWTHVRDGFKLLAGARVGGVDVEFWLLARA